MSSNNQKETILTDKLIPSKDIVQPVPVKPVVIPEAPKVQSPPREKELEKNEAKEMPAIPTGGLFGTTSATP
jgi:hypothetical protein